MVEGAEGRHRCMNFLLPVVFSSPWPHKRSGCSWGAVSDRGRTKALLLPHDGPTCGICATLSGRSLSSHVPRALFTFLP